MNEANILKQFFQDQLGEGYDVQAFRNAVHPNAPSSEVLRVIQTTEEIVNKMLASKVVRAVLRTSQSDYIGLSIADGSSFIWSLELSAPVDGNVDDDLERIRLAFTEKIIPVQYNGNNYEMLIAFTLPAKFTVATINGKNYQQVVWGGRSTIVKNSVLANGYSFYLDGAKIPGVLSLSNGFTAIGENYTTERTEHQRTGVQTFTNAVGLSIHATKNNEVIQRIINASMLGDTNGFKFEIRQNNTSVALWKVTVFNQVNVSASLGSYVLIDVQILRS